MAWTRALDLDQWADQLDARGLLPLLVRRLAAETGLGIVRLNIPAQEQIGKPGFDGHVEAAQDSAFVPAGISVWEMGAGQDPSQKAEHDFAKRLAEASSEVTFVFVTPRNWPGKEIWAASKADSAWKAVKVYDANDLEHVLERARGVDAWISTVTRRLPAGLQSLEKYWHGLSAIAAYPLLPEVFTESRDTEATGVLEWLAGQPDSLFVRTASLHDGIDFLAALAAGETQKSFTDTPFVPLQPQVLLQDAIVVHTAEEWRQLAIVKGSLLLIPSPTLALSASDVASAVEGGHYVFVSGPRSTVPAERAIELRGLAYFELEQSLESSGFSDAEAAKFAKGCCGSSTILKRLITRHPDRAFPEWSRGEEATRVAPFALVGGWRHIDPTPQPKDSNEKATFRSTPPIDIDVVTALVGCERDYLDHVATQLSTADEPLFSRFGDRVLVTSREDAWHLLGRAITDEQLKRFADFAALMLDEDNPALELEEDKRWMAAIYDKTHTISTELRRSLAESLALMAVYPTLGGPKRDAEFLATVHHVIEKVLPVGCSWQRWASLGENLQTIAEAAPDLFLQRVEGDLDSATPALPQLFIEGMGGISGGRLHCHLLWALETLAWSPEHLLRAAIILAKLVSRIPPKDNYTNRPENSLSEIFLLWLWHTTANTEHRLDALRAVLRVAPDTGWKLLTDLLPSGHTSVSHNTAMPRWRPWADGWSRQALQPYRREYVLGVADLAIQQAGLNPTRWSTIVEGLFRINDETTSKTIAALKNVVEHFHAAPHSAFALWRTLRALIALHERYLEADWAFKQPLLNHLKELRDAIAPIDPVLKYQWLFTARAELDEPRRAEDWDAHAQALYHARRDALLEILEAGGMPDVFRLLKFDADAVAIGWILAKDQLIGWHSIALPELLATDDEALRQLARSFVFSAFGQAKWTFVEELRVDTWHSEQALLFAQALPSRRDVWEWVATLGTDFEDDYWNSLNQYLWNLPQEDLEFATDSLIRRGRGFAAIRILRSPSDKTQALSSDRIANVLESALTDNDETQQVAELAYEIQQLIKSLQQDDTFDRSRLALIEWGYLPLLNKRYCEVGPDTLKSAIAEEPELFVNMIAASYRSETPSTNAPKLTPQEQIKARRAFDFLEELDCVPGLLDNGRLNGHGLATWLGRVRELAAVSGHTRITESIVGQIVARAITDRLDEPWIVSEIAPLLEQLGTDRFFNGLTTGLLNSRGVTMRGPFDGGAQERELASQYRHRGQRVRDASGQLASVYEDIARRYESQAKREDEDAERHRLGR